MLREWSRLRNWIDDDRDGLRLLRHLSDAAASWDTLGRDQGELYRGARLEQAIAWQAGRPNDLNPLEREFIGASRELREADERAAQEQLRNRTRQNRRLRIALAVVALALAGAIAGTVVALDQRGTARDQTARAEGEAVRANEETERADEQTRVAQGEATRAEEEAAAAEAARTEEAAARSDAENARFVAETSRLVESAPTRADDDSRQGLLIAAEAHRRAPSPETLGALQTVLVNRGGLQGYLGSGAPYIELEFSADGNRLMALANGSIEVYDMTTRTLGDAFEIERATSALSFSDELTASLSQAREEAVVATARGDVVVYSLADGSTLATIQPDGATVTEVAIAPNDGRIAVGHEDGTVSIWDRDGTGSTLRFQANANAVTEIVFNPSGTLLVTASTQFIVDDGESGTGLELPDAARLWNTASGEQVGSDLLLTPAHRLQDFEPVANIEFTADGETLITSGPRVLRRWSIPSGELLVSTTAKLPGDRLPLFIQSWAALSEGRMFVATNLGLLVLDGPRLEPETDVALLNVSSSASGAIAANEGGSLVAFGGTSRILLWSPSGQQLLARVFPTGLPDAIGLPLDAYRLKTAPNTFDTRPPHYWDIRDPNPKPMQFAPKHYIPDATTTGGPDQEPVLAMTYFNPDDPPGHVELWDRQTLTDTGVRLPISGITAFDLDRSRVGDRGVVRSTSCACSMSKAAKSSSDAQDSSDGLLSLGPREPHPYRR